MSVALALSGYALVIAFAAPRLLVGASWVSRAPRLGVALWQALSASMLASVVLAGIALAVPLKALSGGLAMMLRACIMALRAGYRTPGGLTASVVGVLVVTTVLCRTGWAFSVTVRETARQRRSLRDHLTLVARRDLTLDVLVVDHDTAAAYCLPGRGRRVVVTRGALTRLDDAEVTAVLAHEWAHLKGHHHLVLMGTRTISRAWPRITLFTKAHDEVARLLEMQADDAASRHHDRLTVASALLNIASGAPVPAASMAAGTTAAAERIRRMLDPRRPLSGLASLAAAGAITISLLAPIVVASAPAAWASTKTYCPITG